MSIKLKKLDIANRTEVAFVEKQYVDSFPLSERRPADDMFKLYQDNSSFTILMVKKNDDYVGFLTFWDLGNFIFAEHFAIAQEFRNGGFGGKVMKMFTDIMTKPIILEVELPNTILAERRIGFYQRLGFKLWENIQYQQPAYYEETGTIPMKLMTLGDIEIEKNLMEIRSLIYKEVYNC